MNLSPAVAFAIGWFGLLAIMTLAWYVGHISKRWRIIVRQPVRRKPLHRKYWWRKAKG